MIAEKYFLVFFSCLCLATCVDLPKDIKKCSLSSNSSTLNTCLLEAINTVIPKLEKGFPELEVESSQPLKLYNFSVKEGTGVVHVVQNYQNAEIFNVIHLKAEKVSATVGNKELKIQMDLFGSRLKCLAQYQLDGHILILPVYGNGDVEINLYDVKLPVTLDGILFEKGGETYLKFKNFKVKIFPKRVTYDFKNLFNGNKAYGDNINKVLNDNDLDVFKDVQQGYEDVVGKACRNVVNSIVTKVPFKKLVLP